MACKSNHSAFRQFLTSYLLILFIPLLIGIYAYVNTVVVLENNAKRTNLSILEESRNSLDTRFAEIEDLIARLMANEKVTAFKLLNKPLTPEGLFKRYEVSKEISAYDTNRFISGLYAYFPNSDVIATSTAAYYGEEHYNQFFAFDQLSYEQWRRLNSDSSVRKQILPATNVMFNGEVNRRIPYVNTISQGQNGKANASVIVLIDEETITSFLRNLLVPKGWAYILDSKGRIIASTDHQKSEQFAVDLPKSEKSGYLSRTIAGSEMLISFTSSLQNGWKYVAILPTEVVLINALYIKKMIWALAAIALMVGVLFAAYLAYRNSKPINELADTIKEFIQRDSYDKKNLYDVLKGAIREILSKHEQLQETMKWQAPFLKAAIMDRLLRGELKNKQELDAVLNQMGIPVTGSEGIVVVLQIKGYNGTISECILKELYTTKVIIKKRIVELCAYPVIFHDISDDAIALLLTRTLDRDEDVKDVRKFIAQMASAAESVRLSIGVGNKYGSLLDVWRSYNEAKAAVEFSGPSQSTVWYHDIPKVTGSYYYPLDVETRLINIVKSGDPVSTEQLLRHIFEQNFTRSLPSAMSRQLIHELKGTYVKLWGQLDGEVVQKYAMSISMLDETSVYTAEDQYRHLSDIFIDLSKKINAHKLSHNNLLKNQILDYIHTAYTEHDFSLAKTADRFQLSESYLSYFFKEATGEKMSVYVENLRMAQARRLLTDTDLSMIEMATVLGYTSDKAFSRAFKRTQGIQPTQFRRLARQEVAPSE